MEIHRYEEVQVIATNLDPLSDIVTWLEYFGAADYITSLLTTRHGATSTDAKKRTRVIISHVRLARDYVDQALSGPRDVAFLPSYYAILNLLKVCILFGPHHARLPANRLHGAQYPGYAKDSQSLLTERVVLKRTGALPLFYETLTGKTIKRNVPIMLSQIYPNIFDIGIEYEMATGHKSDLVGIAFDVVEVAGRNHLRARLNPTVSVPSVRGIKALVGFRKDPSLQNAFLSRALTGTLAPRLREHLRPFLLYDLPAGGVVARVSGSHLLLPEEFTIAIAFFHMSSVVRYKPEFLARLKDSKYWPVLSTLRRHALFRFLVMFWSFTHKRTLLINPPHEVWMNLRRNKSV